MNVTLAERSATERQLDIEYPGEELKALFESKLDTYRKQIKLKGFRPGKLPRDVVVKRFGDSIRAEALEEVVQKAVREACRDQKIDPVGPGRIEKLETPEDGPVKILAVMEVDPEIELSGYDNLGIKPAPVSVGDEAVEARLEDIRMRMAELKDVERPSKAGDYVLARYLKIVLDGEERPVGETSQFQAEIGKGIPEVDAGLTGVQVGQQVDIRFTFPADYQDEGLRGKSGEYLVMIEGMRERILPELDDALAQKIGPFENLAALRDRVRTDLVAEAERQSREQAYEQAIETIISRNPFEVPKARIQSYIAWQRDQMAQYQPNNAPALEDMIGPLTPMAEKALKRFRILDWIGEKEKIQPTPEEVDARVAEFAARMGAPVEEVRNQLRKSGRIMEVREELRNTKTLDWLVGIR